MNSTSRILGFAALAGLLGGGAAAQQARRPPSAPAPAQTQAQPAPAQAATVITNTAVPTNVDFLHQPVFPPYWHAFRAWNMSPIRLTNPRFLTRQAQSGTVPLTLKEVIELALADNLTIASADYDRLDALADLLRTEGGGAARGAAGVSGPTTLFSGAIGASSAGGGGGGGGGAGGFAGGGGGLRAPGGGPYDPDISMSFGTEHSKTPLGNPILLGTNVAEANSAFGGVGYSQGFPTGTAISISGFGARQFQNSNQLFFNPEVVTNLSVGVGQEILPGGIHNIINRAQIIVARNEGKIADAVFRQKVIETVAQAAEDYWDLARLQAEVDISKKASDYGDQLLADTRELVERGKAPEDQLIQVESQRTTLRQNEIAAETDARKQATKLKFALAREWDAPLIAARLVASDPLPLPTAPPNLSEQAVIRLALANRPEIEQDRYDLQSKEVAVKVTRDRLMPSLWVGASYSASGLSGLAANCSVAVFPCPAADLLAPIPGGISQAFTQSLHREFPDYAVGFSLDVPLRSRVNQADQARAELDYAQAQVKFRNQENQLAQQVDSDLIDLDGAVQKLQEVTAAKNLAQEALANAQARFQLGATTVTTVIAAQNALLDLQKAEIEARTAYAKAQIELAQASGTILKQFSVRLPSVQAQAPRPASPWKIPALPAGNR